MKAFVQLLLLLLSTTLFSQPNTEVFLFDLNDNKATFQLSDFENISENNGYNNQPSFMDNETILYAGTRNGQTIMVQHDIKSCLKTWISSSEGGEYWPLKTPNQNAVSAIRLDADGKTLAIVRELISQKLAPKLENIKWIAGNWRGEAFGGQTEENWSEPSGGSMMATFKLIANGKVVFYEIEIIREVENTLILQLKHFGNDLKGWEEKDKTVDFPLKEVTTNKVIFEGMIFEKINTNEMNIYVDIKQENGSIETVKFNYKK